MTILVIEDDELNLKLVRTHLELKNYRVVTAVDAESGIEIARKAPPDLVLMDIQLPGMSGIEAMKEFQNDPGLSAIPIIALSAYAMKTEIEDAKNAGFADYLTKPIDAEVFHRTIASYLTDQ